MAKTYSEPLITAFLTHCHASDIMTETGISKTKYYRLKADPEFQRILTERRGQLIKEAVLKMESYLSDDVEILQSIITNPSISAQVRINGINTMMNQLASWEQMTQILERIQRLENNSQAQIGTI